MNHNPSPEGEIVLLQPKIAEEVLTRATATGADFGEIYLEDQTSQNINLRSGKIEAVTSGRSHGAGIRLNMYTTASPAKKPAATAAMIFTYMIVISEVYHIFPNISRG